MYRISRIQLNLKNMLIVYQFIHWLLDFPDWEFGGIRLVLYIICLSIFCFGVLHSIDSAVYSIYEDFRRGL